MKKKVLSQSVLDERTVKNLVNYLIVMTVVAVAFVLFVIACYVGSKVYDANGVSQIFVVLFAVFILWTIISYIIKGYKKLKNAREIKRNYTLVETYLLRRETRESSDEHGDSDVLTFWCGERFGVVDAFSAGGDGIGGRKMGTPFYVAVRYSVEKNGYIGEWCFSKRKYELDDELNNRVIRIPYEEYEEKAAAEKMKFSKK